MRFAPDLAHVRAVTYKTTAECLLIDAVTLKHLEVVAGSEGGPQGSLLNEIDRTVTSMGGRWHVEVVLRRAGFDDVRHTFDLDIVRTAAAQ